MKNSVWHKPDLSIYVTGHEEDAPSAQQAAYLQAAGIVPADYVLLALDVSSFPQAPQATWRWSGSALEVDAGLLKGLVWQSIKERRDALKLDGGYTTAGKWFHSDVFSRSQQLGLVLIGANIPAGLQWKTMDGTSITMTPTLAQQILAAAALQDSAIFAVAEQHRAAVYALADPVDIAAYDWSINWPATYAPAP